MTMDLEPTIARLKRQIAANKAKDQEDQGHARAENLARLEASRLRGLEWARDEASYGGILKTLARLPAGTDEAIMKGAQETFHCMPGESNAWAFALGVRTIWDQIKAQVEDC
jgi:hypothetical protein